MVVFGLGKNLLFKSMLGRCAVFAVSGRVVEMMSKVKESFINHSEWSRNKRMRMMLLQWHFSPFNMHLQLLQCLLSL